MTAAANPWRAVRGAALAAAVAAAFVRFTPPALAQAAPRIDAAGLARAAAEADRQTLLRTGKTQAERDDAARRLVARPDAALRAALTEALRQPPPP
ncbi:MAG: hypothetical protein JWO31_2774, partial [Phycisphaerales bacterium]|nr:hypothetical protein [Phycisphaerales bacterium]